MISLADSTYHKVLYHTAVWWTAITFIPYWLPFFRGIMDGSEYKWRHFGLGGSGVDGDFWLPALLWVICLILLWTAQQGPRLMFRILAPLWHLFLACYAVATALRAEERLMFRGDTLGIEWDITWSGPILFTVGFLVVLSSAILGDSQNHPDELRWHRANTIRTSILIGMLPAQFILLRSGEIHGTTDSIGVLLLILQLMLLPWAWIPERK